MPAGRRLQTTLDEADGHARWQRGLRSAWRRSLSIGQARAAGHQRTRVRDALRAPMQQCSEAAEKIFHHFTPFARAGRSNLHDQFIQGASMTATPQSAVTAQLRATGAGAHPAPGGMQPWATRGLRGASAATLVLVGLFGGCNTHRVAEAPVQAAPRPMAAQVPAAAPAPAPVAAMPTADSVVAAPMARARMAERLATGPRPAQGPGNATV